MSSEYPITITVVQSEQPQAAGVELDNPNEDSPIYMDELHPQARDWILNHPALTGDDPDAWVFITDDYRVPNAVNVVDELESVDIRPARIVEWIDSDHQSEAERERTAELISEAMTKSPTREQGRANG